MQKLFVVFIFFFTICTQTNLIANEKIMVYTLPKSGTHLIHKINELYQLASSMQIKHANCLPTTQCCRGHNVVSKRIILIRDLRDIVVSFCFFMSDPQFVEEAYNWVYNKKNFQQFFQLENIQDKILFFLKSFLDRTQFGFYAYQSHLSRALHFIKQHNDKAHLYILKFENLMGDLGGGSDFEQIKTLKELGLFLGKELDDDSVKNIAKNMWGNTYTFSNRPDPKVGQWKKYFTDEIKILFKEVLGQALIDLGYEKDYNW